jgi:outer membrane protein OmpA-like peptidoglycan-associated protein
VGTIDDFRKSSTSLTAGFELFPHGRVTFFGRYIYGLTNINNTGRPDAYEYYNRNLQLGLKVRIFGGYIASPPPPAPVAVAPVDTDGDGINDADDKCPNQAGVAKYAGCPIPDTDGDGINDELDKCPAQKGMAKYGGCPIPDTDGDGINDEDDKCPSQSGVARYGGCPIPDTDGDGVNDEEDKCPNRAGPADNFGCPVIGIKSYEIAFRSNKAVLLPNSKLLLDTVVTYLQTNAGVKVTIDGHTDNTGSDKINDPLSVKRAEATKAYLVSKGIDAARMTTAGYGSKRPIADNKTAIGKRKNRRIEIKIQ